MSNGKNLYQASHQWASRPDDERYGSLESMLEACKGYAQSAATASIRTNDLDLVDSGDNIALVGPAGTPATLTHYAFGQLSRLVGAPAEYLRKLPAAIAIENLSHGLRDKADDRSLSLLLHKNGSLVTRAITTESYDRVWNYEILERIVNTRMVDQGWRVPPARPARTGQVGTRVATEADILPNQGDFGLAIKVGDLVAPAGLYASDHDMFCFLVNHTNPIADGQKFLNRGVFIQNSEVGDCSLKFKMFTYDNVCGNHIVWGVHSVSDVSIRHVKGQDQSRGKTLQNARAKWSIMSSASTDNGAMERAIQSARTMELGATKDEVLNAVFRFAKPRGLTALTRNTVDAAYDTAVANPRYGSPRSVWGLVNGLTENSQNGHTDSRTDLDVQAGRLMEMVF